MKKGATCCIKLSFDYQITFSRIAQRDLDWTCDPFSLLYCDKLSQLLILVMIPKIQLLFTPA